jgi:hypothetical protein
MLSFDDYIVEKFALPNKKWVDYDMSKLSPDDAEVIWKMYVTTYQGEGLDLSADDSKELVQKYKATWLIDVDKDKLPDAFIVYKETKYGNKIALLGTNGIQEAKRELVKYLLQLVNRKGWFIEASMKMEDLMRNSGVPVVNDETAILDIVGKSKEPEMLEDGYYKRYLSKADKKIVKRIYGILK